MRRLFELLLIFGVLGAAHPARAADVTADHPYGAPQGENALLGVNLDKYKWQREKEATLDAGQRFMADLRAKSAEVAANAEEAIRFRIQHEETEKLLRQKNYVVAAYAAVWVVLLIALLGLWARHRRLSADLAELETRLRGKL